MSDSETDWLEEANVLMQDVKNHVKEILIANLASSKKKIYFNFTTLELKDFCMEMTVEGFRIIGEKYDSDDKRGKYPIYETPYSMLDNISPAYRDSFGNQLVMKLNQLKEEREQEENAELEEQEDADT